MFLDRARVDSRHGVMVGLLEQARLGAALGESGVRWLAIKGPALAVQTTGAPAGRGGGDIDVFVPLDSVRTVYELLHDMGWIARPVGSARPGSWAWRHILGTFHEMTFDGPVSTVDLHWRLDPTHHALPGLRHRVERARGCGGRGHHGADPRAEGRTGPHLPPCRPGRLALDPEPRGRAPAGAPPQRPGTARCRPWSLSTLRVTDAMLGLPAATPSDVRDGIRQVPRRVLRRAVSAQDHRVVAAYPFPAAQTLRDVRYRLVAGGSADDSIRTVVAAIIPPKVVAGLDDPSIVTALPRALLYRARWLVRRSVAWVRRDPGASVIQSPRTR